MGKIRTKADLTKKNIKALKKDGIALIVLSIIFTAFWMVGYYYYLYFGTVGSIVGFMLSMAAAGTYLPTKELAREKKSLMRARKFLIFYLVFIGILQLALIPVTILYTGYLIWAMIGATSIITIIPASIGVGICKTYKKLYKKNVASLNKTITGSNVPNRVILHAVQTGSATTGGAGNKVQTGNTNPQPLHVQPTTYMPPNTYMPAEQVATSYPLDYPVIDEPVYPPQNNMPPNNVQNGYYQNPYQVGNIYVDTNNKTSGYY